LNKEKLIAIKERFPKKPFALHHWLEGADFYGDATDSIAILDKGSQLIYASSKSSFEAIDSFLKDIGEDM